MIVKMLLHRSIIPALLLLLYLQKSTARSRHVCPIGFNLAYYKSQNSDPICYRRKGPETFDDKFTDCAGNLFTSRLYHSLNITKSTITLWTDYKSLYPGGPFIDWSYNELMGDMLTPNYSVDYDPNLGIDEELCVFIHPVTNFTAARCNEKHYRYCFLKPLEDDEDDMDRDGCEDLKDFSYWRFWSPIPTCLTSVTPTKGRNVRATWRQAQKSCAERKGYLLSTGWRYASSPLFHSETGDSFPLGIMLSADNTTIEYDNENITIPPSDFKHFEINFTSNMSLGALRDDFWFMVNSSYVFYNVICERPIQLRPISMDVSVTLEGKLVLKTNETVKESNIRCFTDSVLYYPYKVKVRYDRHSDLYVLHPIDDGYYWCVHIDSRNHTVSESNKALFIRIKDSLVNYYAVKLRLSREHKFDLNMEKFNNEWLVKLKQYIYYRTKYVENEFDDALNNQNTTEDVLKLFKEKHPHLDWDDKDVILKKKIKKRYLDEKTTLVHVLLHRDMKPVFPGTWDNLTVEFMKPVYYCPAFGVVDSAPIGSSRTVDCQTHTCVGEFNEGVQWLTKATEGCVTTVRTSYMSYPIQVMPTPGTILPSTRNDTDYQDSTTMSTSPTSFTTICDNQFCEYDWSDSDEDDNATTDYVIPDSTSEMVSTVTMPPPTTEGIATAIPTFNPLPPDEQLQQVINDLESLINNTDPVMVDDIDPALDQVDTLLDTNEDLDIPGRLLILLDTLGTTLNLNGSRQASTVRNNIAMLLADSDTEQPVRGLRLAAMTDGEVFSPDGFEMISEPVNSTHLMSNNSEAVVHLPESLATEQHRISFIIFRNNRAFRDTPAVSVNSRILSIKVNNITEFDHGEVIDIHLSPLQGGIERNQSRACAYWHFVDKDTGFWSQEGCTFVRSTEEGMLDTCRCDHLTHFAQILVSREVFSQRNEDALEILSIVGCFLSIFGLLMIGITAALFRPWRRDYNNKIWLQLSIAIFIMVICFLVVVFAKFDHYNIPCMLVGVLLHYSVLASFCWMLVAAVLSYRRLVIVFTRDASHKLLRASAFSWGVPCVIVGILLSVDPHSYAGRFDEKYPSGTFCYPSGLGLWLAVYAPVALMLLANWTLFGLIVRSVFGSRRIQRHGDSKEVLRCASVSCLLVFLFGLPWIFGLFGYNIVGAYLFTLTATFQGFILFLFFVLGNKKTRDLWFNKLKIKQTRKIPVTSSTYTNRSTGYRGPQGTSSIEVNSTKPKSLASPDNSRFS